MNGSLGGTPYIIPYVQVETPATFAEVPYESVRVTDPTLLDFVKKQM